MKLNDTAIQEGTTRKNLWGVMKSLLKVWTGSWSDRKLSTGKGRQEVTGADKMSESRNFSGRRLDSWKEIAEYLGRDVRTAMRWGKADGLPIRHIAGAKGRAVFSYT